MVMMRDKSLEAEDAAKAYTAKTIAEAVVEQEQRWAIIYCEC